MNELMLKKYADLAVKVGVNLQKDQILVISASVECVDFARALTKSGYEAGAKRVVVLYNDEIVNKLSYQNMPQSELEAVIPPWLAEARNSYTHMGAAYIGISSDDPDLLSDIDSSRIKTISKARRIAYKQYTDSCMSNRNRWCVISAPTKAWAKKVFPNLSCDDAISALWEKIFISLRLNEEDPVKAWTEHQAKQHVILKNLNAYNFKNLHYKNSLGTDIVVGLVKDHIWTGAGEVALDGIDFTANMPTEELFTANDKYAVDGTLKSALPLIYNGTIIDEFSLEFKGGKVVSYDAKVGKDILKVLLESDENAIRLGEVALVEHNSPISNMKTLFYNTLFDENASCHFAFGKAYPTCIKGGDELAEKDFDKVGLNSSAIHVDFMVGTCDLSIIGTTYDGKKITVFDKGNFVI